MDSSSSSSASSSEPKICGICLKIKSLYLCPKCGIPYCSLTCYRNPDKHLKCSEAFYKECVQDEIKSKERTNPEEAQKMKDIIARVHQTEEKEAAYHQDGEDGSSSGDEEPEVEGELDSDDDEPLEKRVEGINLDDYEVLWKALTPEEQEDFKRQVNDGNWKKWVEGDPEFQEVDPELEETPLDN